MPRENEVIESQKGELLIWEKDDMSRRRYGCRHCWMRHPELCGVPDCGQFHLVSLNWFIFLARKRSYKNKKT